MSPHSVVKRQLRRWICAVVAITALYGVLRVGTQGTPAPILLVVNTAEPNSNRLGPYLGEILKSEGLNYFSIAELSTVTSTSLNDAQIVVLADTELTPAQALLFANFANAGGRLIAMRPDARLSPALGLTAATTSTGGGYFGINAGSFADGFPAATLPFQGQARHYSPAATSQVLSMLYSDATTATIFPAIVRYNNTISWTYDLATSVIDAVRDNTIDRSRIRLQDDVQMRMLARNISDLMSTVMPLPRLWYFPYTAARHATTMAGLSWSSPSHQLSFSVTVPDGAPTEVLALPQRFGEFEMTSVAVDGSPVARTQEQIDGRPTAFVGVPAGSHGVVVSYDSAVAVASGTLTIGSTADAAAISSDLLSPGASLQFNGTSQRARFTTLPALTAFTVEGWAKRTSDTGGWETFFSNVDTSYNLVSVNVYVDGGNVDCGSAPADQFAWAYKTASGWFIQCSGVRADLNAWHHIAVTRDSSGTGRIFIDGVLRATASGTQTPTASTGAFSIGNAGDSASEYFPGLLDEIRISTIDRYSGNFTPQSSMFATDASTFALYHLDEGTGQTLADASGNNRNGFLGTSAAIEAIDPVWSSDVPFVSTDTAPAFTTQPANQTVSAGQSATFTVAATGVPAPVYQWQISAGGAPFTNLANVAPYSGVTTPILTITGATTGLSGNQYRAMATNGVAPDATSLAATLTVNTAPVISAQPTNQTVIAGQNVTFTASATGTPSPTIQWQISTNGGTTFTNLANGAPYSGVTTNVLAITGATSGLNNNQYRIVATNTGGTATSAAATLTVTTGPSAPVITTHPANQSVAVGATASFTVAATGSPTPTYQWQVSSGGGPFSNLANAAPYSGVSTATLTITLATVGLSGNQYRAVATNGAGSANSNAATLTVTASAAVFTSETLITGLNEPTSVQFLPDGRMLILSRYGFIQQVQPGAVSVDPVPFLTLTNINTDQGERGLTGFVLDPNFDTNHFFYLFYTANSPLRDRVSRFTMVGSTATPSSEFVVWQDDVQSPWWHHGGTVVFGSDGKLYFSTGDGFDRGNEVQPLTSYRGKILRVNTDGTIPTDNPFYDGSGPNKDEIFARGLRNPFRMSFDSGTGDLYIGDVGANDPATSIEEVNRWRFGTPAGLNFGWPTCQGPCAVSGMTNPLFSYPHAGRDSSITGGFVYRGGNFGAAYEGSYFYGDYVQNWIKRLTFDGSGNVTANLNFEPPNGASDGPYGEIVDLKQGPDGALYYVDIGISWEGVPNPGTVRRIRNTVTNLPPQITSVTYNPQSGTTAPLTVNFQAAATDPEGSALTYSWVFGDGQSATGASVSHTYAARGPYTARLTVSDGVNQTLSNPLPITVGRPPTVSITAPVDQSLFRAGDAVAYAGTASDDGPLTAANYSWRIVMVHDSHTHPAAGPFAGITSGTFAVPGGGHELDNSTVFQFILTVTDSDGLQSSAAVIIRPDTVNLSFDAAPSGLTILIDNLPRTTPISNFNIVKNFQLALSAPSPQTLNNNGYEFSSWSDGQAQTHTITVPSVSQSYSARFALQSGASLSSLQFNGSTQRARFTVLPSLPVLTVEGWVKRTGDTGGYETFFSDASTSYAQETVGVFVDGGNADCGSSPPDQFAWAYTRVTGGWFLQCSGVTADLNVWHHVAVTRDGFGTARMFVDGVLKATATNTAAAKAPTGFFGIGEAGDATTEYFPGRLDEIRISSVARYTGNFSLQATNFVTDANTVALYHLDEGTGQVLTDSSGNGRHGVLGTSSAIESIDPVWSTDIGFAAPPPPPLPTISFSVSPTTITAGSPATLSWSTANATDAAIDQNVGSIPLTGTRSVSPPSTTTYTLTAFNAYGSATASATVTVNVPPAISVQPGNQSVDAGQNATFTVSATGTPAPAYQWQVSAAGAPFTNLTNAAPYSGAATATLTITSATNDLSGNQYRAVATNSAGSVASNAATLTVTIPAGAPAITAQPANQTILAGQNASFTVAATGVPTPTYQWQVSIGGGAFTNLTNTATYSGTTTTTLTITGATTVLSGNQYRAVATNSVSAATSNAATLTVNAAPAITAQPSNLAVYVGQNATFSVSASGAPTPAYQWQVSVGGGAFTNLTNTAPYSGATTAVLTISSTTIGLSGNQYRAIATNIAGSAVSNAAALTVTVPPPGGSLSFNGSNQRAVFTTLPAMTAFTVEGWVKRTSDTGRYETFLSDATNGYGQETVGIYVDGGDADCGSGPSDQFAWAYTKVGGGWFFQCSGVRATLNTWFHIAVTKDASNTTRIFIDGVLKNTITGAAAPATAAGTLALGTAGDAVTEFFPGLLDEVRISSTVRYSATFAPQTTPYSADANTVALYHLDETTAQTLSDASGNNRNGVLGSSSAVETIDPLRSTDAPVH